MPLLYPSQEPLLKSSDCRAEARPLHEIYDRCERLRVEACPAHKRAVQFFLRHQPLYVVRLDAATIKNPQRGGLTHRKLLPSASPEEPVSFGGNFRGRGTARANGPDWLVRNQNTGELVGGQRTRATGELPAENFLRQASVAVFLRFTQTNDGSQAGIERDQRLLGDVIVRFTEELAALGVADDDVAAAGLGEHRGGDFAGEGAFLTPGDVLARDGDVGAFRCLGSRGDGGERRRDDDVAVPGVCDQWCERREKRAGLR